ncbi:type VII secretion protein EccB [Streptacidiphilus sp. EB129]|uniref:type VII secretion protein EccB n=1 Tax=Streptacidiphilus sp. EB129 TaxID=3156262 RepID=UPI003513473C
MQTRRDQLQAHLFTVGRLVSGLVQGEPDVPETPMRRSTTGVFVGVAVTMLIIVGSALFGLISPSASTGITASNTLLVDQRTGARYLYLDGELRPVLNYSSALLILNSATPTVKTVSSSALDGAPHGLPVGIPDAPETLPSPTAPTRGAWSVCAATVPDSAGRPQPVVTAEVGPARLPTVLDDRRALLVRTPDGSTFLAWHDRRLLIPAGSRTALGYDAVQPFQVGASWVSALPAGPDLTARAVDGLGSSGPVVNGSRGTVGQIFRSDGPSTPGSPGNLFVLLRDGLAPLSPVDAALLLGDPATIRAYGSRPVAPIPVSAAALGAVPPSATSAITAGYPPTVPQAVGATAGGTQVPCFTAATGPDAGPVYRVATESAADPLQSTAPTGGGSGTGGAVDGPVADHVQVPPGGGLEAVALAAPGVSSGTLYLVTDLGLKYPLASANVAKTLGYGAVDPVPVPTTLLALLPTGPVLDPATAGETLPMAAASTAAAP